MSWEAGLFGLVCAAVGYAAGAWRRHHREAALKWARPPIGQWDQPRG